jgi:hypothetical protein
VGSKIEKKFFQKWRKNFLAIFENYNFFPYR